VPLTMSPAGGCITYLSSAVVTLDAMSMVATGAVFTSLGAAASLMLKLTGSLVEEFQVMVWGTERSTWGVPLLRVLLGQVIVIAGGC
jgi:hypothetical protein